MAAPGTLQRTPLFAAHQRLHARMVEFGGWEMPVQYTSIAEEHAAVRSAAGLFDISHMGEFEVSGQGALTWLNLLLTNNIERLAPGQGQYTLLCNAQGGVRDDLYVYRLEAERFLLIVNASRLEADRDWFTAQLPPSAGKPDVSFRDLSSRTAALALQGPAARAFIDRPFPASPPLSQLKKNRIATFSWEGNPLSVACTGYTGEDGFEIIAPAGEIERIWEALLAAGRPFGLKPAGLGARDTLRTEMCFPLYGQELEETTTPWEAGLDRFVDLSKEAFMGRAALLAQSKAGLLKKLAAFIMTGKTPPPRPHYSIHHPETGEPIGIVTSGTQSPSLRKGIGLGYVPPSWAVAGSTLHIQVRGNLFPAEVAPKPLYRRS